jgi:hypothetical protein
VAQGCVARSAWCSRRRPLTIAPARTTTEGRRWRGAAAACVSCVGADADVVCVSSGLNSGNNLPRTHARALTRPASQRP